MINYYIILLLTTNQNTAVQWYAILLMDNRWQQILVLTRDKRTRRPLPLFTNTS